MKPSLLYAIGMIQSIIPDYDSDIEKIKKQFRETMNLPRKQKKEKRKHLKLKYNLLIHMKKMFSW